MSAAGIPLGPRGMKLSELFSGSAAVLTWAVVMLATLPSFRTFHEWPLNAHAAAFGFIVFIVAFLVSDYVISLRERRYLRHLLVLVMVLSIAAIGLLLRHTYQYVLIVITATLLPEVYDLSKSSLILLATLVVLALSGTLVLPQHSTLFPEYLLYVGFSVFALMSSHIAQQERKSRLHLSFLNQQLKATQALLATTAKQDERLRIARELHDVVGHHLAALNLNLEIAKHTGKEPALEQIIRAHSISKLLLSNVRDVVSDMRALSGINLREALEQLGVGLTRPRLELVMDSAFSVSNTRVAEAVFRCVQEIQTNCVKHSTADTLRITIRETASHIALVASDNGSGPRSIVFGNGLTGMRERVEALGGSMTVDTGHGVTHSILLPKMS
jgi:signal transduction histidine kinase